MLRLKLTAFLIALQLICFAQSNAFSTLMDSGKAEFKTQFIAQEPDFNKAYDLFNEAVKLKPSNAEALYFLAYTTDKLSMAQGMQHAALPLSLKASMLFEKVNKLQPTYKGEMLLLDPYSKLTAIWGSLAFSYFNANKGDSALWALQQGKKRGGFIEPILEFNRQLLASCKDKAILVTTGDNITFSLLYLQEIEKLRTDVTIVDGNLLNANWYPKYLRYQKSLGLSYNDAMLDTLDYTYWQSKEISIINEKDSSQKFSWTLKPTYFKDYLLRGDRIMLDIFKQNLFKRDIYFSTPSDSSINLFLTDYLMADGTADRVACDTSAMREFNSISKNFQLYNMDKLKQGDINKSSDALKMWNGCRLAYLAVVVRLYNKEDFKNAA